MTSSDSTSTGSEYLNALAEMTEKMTNQALSAMNHNQQAVADAVARWAQGTPSLIPQPPSAEALQAMPKPTELVDRGFEIAEQLLAAQHSFAKKLMEAVQEPMSRTATGAAAAAQDVADAAVASSRAAADSAADTSESIAKTVKNAFSKTDPAS